MPEIILHHYPQSPVSEKVRIVLGMKGLAWRSVIIPRLPPKPDLMPLTGGYRLTPVMQIGADVYCDSQCIIRELERRCPEPTLFPGGSDGMAWAVGRWADGPLFQTAIAVVFGAAEELPAAFAADRGALYFGPAFDLAALKTALPHHLAQLRAQFAWIDQRIGAGRDFLLGAQPGLPDALCYYLVWFIRGRTDRGPDFLSQFSHLLAWEERVGKIGHGSPSDLDAEAALEIAREAGPEAGQGIDPLDPLGLEPGAPVEVVTGEGNTGQAVSGRLLALDLQEVVIGRRDERVGEVAVHFPRVGYRVLPA
jgi:glutathione S-transferase